MIEPVVIIHVRFVASRARRGDGVRPPANKNIQGGMTFRLTGLRSRLNERHEEKKERKGEGGPEGQRAKGKNRSWFHSTRFHVW